MGSRWLVKLFPPGTPLEPYPPPPLLPEKVVPRHAQPGKIYLSTGEKQLFGIFFKKSIMSRMSPAPDRQLGEQREFRNDAGGEL